MVALWHGYYPVNLLHIFQKPFYKNISWRAASVSLTLSNPSRSFKHLRWKKNQKRKKSLFQKNLLTFIFIDSGTGYHNYAIREYSDAWKNRTSHWRSSEKKEFLKILQNSQENTCASLFFNEVAGLGLQIC